MVRPIKSPNDAETSDKLLFVAALEFARRGFEGAKLADIAEEVGIKRPSLLYHYPSKQELYVAVIRRAFADLGAALEGATAKSEGTFVERFDDLVKRLLVFFDEHTEIATLILRELLDGHGPGQSLLVEAGVPLLLRVEKFVREEGDGIARKDLPVRQALLQIFATTLVKCAAGPLRDPLWGKTDKTRALARALFIAPTRDATNLEA
jgi:AcrR family transcriptional regulator